jgi:predicted RNA-binding protein with PUA-like domain
MKKEIYTGYWLMKTEPEVFSIHDLKKLKKAPWDGVRNYQARNFMRDHMRLGDKILFYHSSTDPAGIAGLAEVSKTAFPDHTALNPKSQFYDPRSTKENPVWVMVEVSFVAVFPHFVSLAELKSNPFLKDMLAVKPGMRLSVQPVQRKHYEIVLSMSGLRKK